MNKLFDINFQALFRRYYPGLLFYATRLVGENDAKDLVQDVFVELWRRRENKEIGEQIQAFLYRAVHTRALNVLKHRTVTDGYQAAMEEINQRRAEYYDSNSNEIIDRIENQELRQRIHNAINALPEKCKEVFKLSCLHEMKSKEIADVLDISLRAVETHIYKALKFLRQHLESEISVIDNYLSGRCTEDELAEINACIKESEEFARQFFCMEEMYYLDNLYRYEDEERTNEAERKLYIALGRKKQQKMLRRWMKYAAIAAVVLSIGGVGYWYYDRTRPITVANDRNDAVTKVELPDGTRVWLNHSATLTYPRTFFGSNRKVHVEGEAYFEVAKNPYRPFIVENDALHVRVLGTQFNLKSSKDNAVAEVSLIEGEVEVRGCNDEGHIVLASGQRAELDKSMGRLTVKQVNTKLDAVWHDDLIYFSGANLSTIANALERLYDVRFFFPFEFNTDKTYSGVLKKKETVEQVLQSLQNSIPFDYRIDGKSIFILNK